MSDAMFRLGFDSPNEEIQVDPLNFKGKFPSWLKGNLVRNGPGTFRVGEQTYRHWFDGLPMLHKFTFSGSQIAYANKFLDTQAYQSAMNEGKIVYSEFATDPEWTLKDRIKNFISPKITDSAKVNVTKYGENYMALAETPLQVLFDPETLKTLGTFSYEDNLVGQMTTVHPQFDGQHNQAYNLVTRFHQTSHYQIYQLGPKLQPKRIASIPVKKPSYMHSFGMTPNYFILTEFPLVVNSLSLLFWLKPYIENYRWLPQNGTRFTVINRDTGEIDAHFEHEAFFGFHHINAFENDGELIFDIAAYENPDIIKAFYFDQLKSPEAKIPFGKLRRYRLPLQKGSIRYETLSEVCMELPNINIQRANEAGYRYIYAVSVNPNEKMNFYNQLVKVDIQGKHNATWYQSGCFPGEPVFVPRPGASDEDDGVILAVVLDENSASSFLLLLDAQSFQELGRAEIPQPILFGYHGAFFNANQDQGETQTHD